MSYMVKTLRPLRLSLRFAVKKMENVRWMMELILPYHLLTHLNNYHSLSILQKN